MLQDQKPHNRYDRDFGEGRKLTILYPSDMTIEECNQLHDFVELIKKLGKINRG